MNCKKIIELRERNGISRYRLSKLSGIAYSYLSDMEKGKLTNPTIDIAKKLATALKVPLDELVNS